MTEQLWSDERIEHEVRRIGDNMRLYIDDACTVAEQVRDDLRAALDAANATINELQDALDGMRGIAQQRLDRVRELERELAEANDRLSNYDAVWLYYAGLVEGDEPVDLHALHIMYEKGRADERELCRRKEAGE